MGAEEVRRMLLSLLEDGGAEYTQWRGCIRFPMEREGMRWEALCLCREASALVYARYPFPVRDRRRALELCNEVNRQAAHGAVFVPEDGYAVFRTAADMGDIYDARERLERALRNSAALICRFWGSFQACGNPSDAL